MKILSNKEYYSIMNKVESLTRDNNFLQRKLDNMEKEKPHDCVLQSQGFKNYFRAKHFYGTIPTPTPARLPGDEYY